MVDDDVTRRTRLANERTYLAWWRTGLTAFAVSLAAGELIPALSDAPTWPYSLLGAAFAILGIGFTSLAYVRERAVERALKDGGYAPLSERLLAGLTGAGVVLGIALLLVTLAVD